MPKLMRKKSRNVRRGGTGKSRKASSARKTVMMKGGSARTRQAPSAFGIQKSGGYTLKFGPAPYHETYGSGLRVEISVSPATIVRMAASGGNANAIFSGYNGVTTTLRQGSSIGTGLKGVDSSTATSSMLSMLANGSTASPAWSLVGMFSMYNCRLLKARYLPDVSTNIGTSVVLAGVFSDQTDFTETTFTAMCGLQKSVMTSAWLPAELDVIKDRDLRKPASVLYPVANAGGMGTFQQAYLLGAVSALPTSSDTIGRVIVDMVIDLYQMRGGQNVVYPTLTAEEYYRKKQEERKESERKEGEEEKEGYESKEAKDKSHPVRQLLAKELERKKEEDFVHVDAVSSASTSSLTSGSSSTLKRLKV